MPLLWDGDQFIAATAHSHDLLYVFVPDSLLLALTSKL